MKTADLIEALSQFDGDTEVWVAVDDKRGGISTLLSVQDCLGLDDDGENVTLFATE